LRERTKLLEIALVCIKKTIAPKKFAFRRSNEKNMVAGEEKKEVA
jgi:hypothetical protein